MSLSVDEDPEKRKRTSSVGRFFENFKHRHENYGKLERTSSVEDIMKVRSPEGRVFNVVYYGTMEADESTGKAVTARALQFVEQNPSKRKMTMKVSTQGITLVDVETKITVEAHMLHHISQCAYDTSPDHYKLISYIAFNKEKSKYFCHVFKHEPTAAAIHEAISVAFEEAFKNYSANKKAATPAAPAAATAPLTTAASAASAAGSSPAASAPRSTPSLTVSNGEDGFDGLARQRTASGSGRPPVRQPSPTPVSTGNLIEF
ncbi:hypothetical protein CAOG_03338 [Capsaspora owczarzaki ATCC 30864]|uniref:PID domain-containing protein n=1 Tax=Capsaspora owczarzaki (strain ATCC 30864) TaxID=595528 RepID=A0A0D2WP44_CAPO3|nr:hypothetical protein CAOG_03338 [Capsaspora owczarzaki ATCC 30864]KJE92353.1 hypothetical protein CAOG_003338 [Capsaspora owczarzaki ATCC 30864]|eukprot:XP_004364177.1 hypothetical protein CAOG_03338 [Capsaspora owczarzaki ATCC 30864]